MNCFLLYRDKERPENRPYHDHQAIEQDLSLNVLSHVAGQDVVWEKGAVKKLGDTDKYIEYTMSRMLITPCLSEEEIIYRQDILRDCLENEEFIIKLYKLSSDMQEEWKRLGRIPTGKTGNQNSISELVLKLHVLNLFLRTLRSLKLLFYEYIENFKSEGLKNLIARLEEEFSVETETEYLAILEQIKFFIDESGDNHLIRNKPDMIIGCSLGEGMKISSFSLGKIETKQIKFRDPNSKLVKIQNFFSQKVPHSIALTKTGALTEQKTSLEYALVSYVVSGFTSFMDNFTNFFDQLQFQASFYRGAVNLKHHMDRFAINYCFPKVASKEDLRFDELKEFVMCIQQRVNPVGNTCDINDKLLLIVTGANQGGKSTFLRSIGIAQIMMQCGLIVAAKKFESAIFPSFFTHFTRREDSAMNSGRLDEELNRMSQIIDRVDDRSLILLNESFATTTEKEGSRIAYDIIRALSEAGVKILTVTHLLSFAQKMYDEMNEASAEGKETHVEFLSAERNDDGRRTFKMIQHAPELTSFGLDLYKQIVRN